MLTWHITKGHTEGTMVEFGWNGRTLLFDFNIDRDHAEQAGWLKHGDWLMDDKWGAIVNVHEVWSRSEHVRIAGIAFGKHCWAVEWRWINKKKPESDELEA